MLQSAWSRPRFDPWNRYAAITRIVQNPNLTNDNENMVRAMLASSPRLRDLIAALPADIRWIRSAVDASVLGSVSVVRADRAWGDGCGVCVPRAHSHLGARVARQMKNETWEQWSHCGPVAAYARSAAVTRADGPHASILASYALWLAVLVAWAVR